MTLETDLTSEAKALKSENLMLRSRIAQLEHEISFLKTHAAIASGMKGETLVAKLTGGSLTSFAEGHDVLVGVGVKIEVKFSKLNIPNKKGATKRWNWNKPLGWLDKGKDYDFLLLVGEKDIRYPSQYLDDSPYVYFLIPINRVRDIMTSGKAIGANVQINTNLERARSPASIALKEHMVPISLVEKLTNGVPLG